MKVSVIVPVYNKKKYIAECLKCVTSQSLDDIEIICIDDGSTDGSAEIIADFMKKDGRIRLISQANKGSGAARNAGIKAANGEYIAFLDSDDFYPAENTLARLYAAAKANNADICGGSFCEVNGDKYVSVFDGAREGNTFTVEGWLDFCDYQFDYGYYRFIYRRDFLIGNNLFFPNYRRYQDPPFMLRAFDAAGKFYAIPDITYCYRVNSSSVNWTTEKVLDLLCGIEDNLVFSERRGYNRIHCLNYLRLCNDFCASITYVALRNDPQGQILKKLICLQSVADTDILRESGQFTESELSFSNPLEQIIKNLSKQSALINREGWFINKKLFRLYTLPVRMAGKAIRAIKNK